MKRAMILSIIFIFTACVTIGAADAPKLPVPAGVNGDALTLSDCYDLALKQSEDIAITADRVKETEAHFLQALSIMMPYVSFKSQDLQEEPPDEQFSALTSLKPTKSSERRFNVTQNLFSGFKALAAMKGSKYERGQRTEEKTHAEQLLLVDVSSAFYSLIERREDLKSLQKIRMALSDRIRELKAREKLGRSRKSEVVNARTQLYSVEASIELVKNQEIIVRQILEFLVGGKITAVKDTYGTPSHLMDEDYYVSLVMERPDVKAAKFAWLYAKKQREVVDSDFLPRVDWEGNYYTQRTGFSKDTDWDVKLTFSVPIFSGTEVLGKSKEYSLKAHESELIFRRTRRKAPYDIREAYVRLKTAISVHNALEKAYKSAKLNYYLQRKDYERSLVNNLEVLAAIQTLENSERDYIQALYEAKRAFWALRIATGEGLLETHYDVI
ncbi:MAG: TolC family protein [Candidatus Omnitrophica bacterium]|nr:TolC family protein [Candidatus Omnitrophota bacterium]